MISTVIFSLLLSCGFAAAEAEEESSSLLSDFKKDVDSLKTKAEQALNEKKEVPNLLFKRVQSEVQEKASAASKFVKDKKTELMKAQEVKRKEFEATAKKELDEWRASNPGKSAAEFMRAQDVRRKELVAKMREDRKAVETALQEKKSAFDKYVEDFKKTFKTKFQEYSKAFRLSQAPQETPVEKEFKEIPKGQGTKLAPAKE